jgi:hypothetical protein
MIEKCLYMNPNATIYSWAYANSVSLSNMLKVGMSSETRYKTFELKRPWYLLPISLCSYENRKSAFKYEFQLK